MIDIYRSGAVVASVHASDSDKVTKKVMGENTLSLSFTLAAPFNFKVGDYLYFAAEKYTLNITPEVVKRSTTMFDYTLLFEGIEYELRKVRLLFATEAMGIGGGADFSLMGNAALFAQVIVANLNRIQIGWTVGSVIESETKNLTFAGDSCLTAINKVATEFSTEYWIGQDKTVNIGKKGSILPVTFEYGLGNGLYSITRSNVSSKDIITRLYPFGSEQNLPKGYVGKRLQIDGDYIEANVDKYGIVESSQNFDDIKPERTGTITALGADIFTFIDSSMDFDLNAKVDGNTLYLVPGTTAKIHFQSGDLAGYEFELSSYNHATKAFKLIEFTNEIAYKLPNSTLKPAIGDTYIILDIYMPQTYVDAAKARLLAKAQESLAQNSEPQLSYKVAVDPQFVADKGLTFASGDYVGIKDTQLLIDRNIRQVAVTRYLNDPDKYEFDLADTVEPSLTTQILTTLEATDIILKQNKLLDPARARRNWKTVEELRGAIYDVDGYFDAGNIKPFSIETNMLTVGSKGNQFYLDCYFQANYGGSANNLVVGDGSLAHFTIEENIRTWAVTGLTATIPDNNLRYIYVSCLKVGNTAQVTLSATTKAIEDETYYYFLAGVISSVIDSARQISLLFGFTSINGRFIKTGRIQSGDGNTYFDLDSGDIQGKITFKAGSSGYSQLTDKPDLSVFAEKTYVEAVQGDLQDQIDGVVDSWFYNYTPSLVNVPASDWTTTEIKQRHVGDTFTNTQPFVDNATTPDAGKSWRWVNNSGVFSWTPIADSDAVKALLEASKAQDTADGKRRVFTSQPTAPYDAGDLWAKGTSIYKCDVAKVVGQAYSASDWSVTATDDTAAIAAQTAANSANAKISDMASDGKITPVEKKALSQLVDQALSEFSDLLAQSQTYSVSNVYFQDYYNSMLSFAGPLLSDMSATSTVDRAVLEQRFSDYNTAKINLLNAISNAINGTATTAKTAADDAAIIARAMASGKMLNRDPNFKLGWNGISTFNNSGGSALIITRNAAQSDSPNYPGFDMKISYVGGSSGTQPGLGGFTFATQCRANAVFLVRIIAYIPIGYSIAWASNSIGVGEEYRWLTTTNGEGRFKEYLYLVKCGSSGTFSTTNFFYLIGSNASAVEWRLCFATVYDTTSSESYEIDAANYLKEALQGSTEIEGGMVATNLLLLKDALGAITGGMSGLASDNVGVWTGGTYAQALSALAKIILRKDGSGHLAGGKILFDALGALMVGAFNIENGNIKGYADNKEKIKLHTGTIDTIAVMDSAQWQPSGLNFALTNHFSGIIYDRTGIGGGTNKFVAVSTTKTITITESTVLRFISNGVNVRYDPTGDASLNSYTEKYEIVGVASNIAPSAAGVTQNVAAGTYQIVYSLIINSSTADGYDHDVVVTNNTIVEIQQGIERTEIGKNGLLSYFGSNNFFHFSQLTGLQMRGATNMPGILATGSVTSGAAHNNKWGAKTSGNSVTKGGTGVFIVPHSVGSMAFTAIATCTATGYYAAVTAKANGSITVTVKSDGGSVSDQPFDYVIMGAN